MTTSPSIILRPAKPSFEDGLVYAQYLDTAAEGFFKIMLGQKAKEIVGRAFLTKGHSYTYENVLFAEYDSRIVGMASGFSSAEHKTFTKEPLKEIAGAPVFRLKVVSILFAPMMRILNTLSEGDFYILSLATEKEFRGSGIGTMLMDAMEERAAKDGCERISLDVSANNLRAIRLYERRGMVVESQWPKRFHISKLRFYRMAKTL